MAREFGGEGFSGLGEVYFAILVVNSIVDVAEHLSGDPGGLLERLDLFGVGRLARDDQGRNAFIHQHRVGFVDDRVVQTALHHAVGSALVAVGDMRQQ